MENAYHKIRLKPPGLHVIPSTQFSFFMIPTDSPAVFGEYCRLAIAVPTRGLRAAPSVFVRGGEAHFKIVRA